MQKTPGRNPPNFTPARRPDQQPNTKGALDFLQSNDRLAALLPTLSQLAHLQTDCERLLPTLFANCRVLQLREGALQVAVPNAALATRLKQVLPKLQDGLRHRGWSVELVKLKLQPLRELPAETRYLRTRPGPELSSTAISSFKALMNSLEESPANTSLSAAISKLLDRRKR